MALIGTAEVSKQLGLTMGRIRTMIASGIIKAEKVGRDWLVEESEVARLKATERKRGRPASRTKKK
jgi:excisionase family DNA binding protein